MRRASLIQKETEQISSVRDLTAVFEAIASTQIAKIKDRVELAQSFFDLLWKAYTAIRVDPNSRITSRAAARNNQRRVFVVISAESGLSGDIDQRLIEAMIKDFDANNTDIIVIGSHGATQLNDRNIHYIRLFTVPESDSYMDVSPIIEAVRDYDSITVYYEVYESLGVQEIRKINLIATIQTMSEEADAQEDIFTDQETIFEPTLDDIADLMERAMMSLALSQAILDSNLAQSASRFNAMASAKKLAVELVAFHKLEYHRSKRAESDRRLREVLIGIKKKKKHRAKVIK